MFGLRVCVLFFSLSMFVFQTNRYYVRFLIVCCVVLVLFPCCWLYSYARFNLFFSFWLHSSLSMLKGYALGVIFKFLIENCISLCARTLVSKNLHTQPQLTFHILICNFRNFEMGESSFRFFSMPRTRWTFLNVDGWRHRLWNSNLIKEQSLCNHNENQRHKKKVQEEEAESIKNGTIFSSIDERGWPYLIPLSSLS